MTRAGPFTLPAATTTRFVLLVVLTTVTTMYAASALIDWEQVHWACVEEAERQAAAPAAPGVPVPSVAEAYLSCDARASLGEGLYGLLVAATFVTMALFLHSLTPRRIVRRQGLIPLPAERYPEAAAEIGRLVTEAGVPGRGQVMIDPTDQNVRGRSFGAFGSWQVRLSLGAVRHHPARAAAMRAVLRHELAHIRNRDLDMVSLVRATWWLFLGGAVATVAVQAVRWPEDLPRRLLPLAVALMVALATTAAISRVREHYADLRAADANRAAGDPAFPPVESQPRRWARLLAWHPPVSVREQVVREPDRLLRPSPLEAVLTGATAGLAQPYLAAFATFLAGGEPRDGRVLAGVAIGVLVAAVTGTAMWRDTLRTRGLGSGPSSGLMSGAALTAGLFIGIAGTLTTTDASLAAAMAHSLPAALASAAILLVLCVGLCRWHAVAADAWFEVSARPVRALAVSVIVGGAAFGSLFGHWSASIGGMPDSTVDTPLPALVFQTVTGLVSFTTLVPVVLALLLPLLPRLRRGTTGLPMSAVFVPVGVVTVAAVIAEATAWRSRSLLAELGVLLVPGLAAEPNPLLAVEVATAAIGLAVALVTSLAARPLHGLLAAYLVGFVLSLVGAVRTMGAACLQAAPVCEPRYAAGYAGGLLLLLVPSALAGGAVGAALGMVRRGRVRDTRKGIRTAGVVVAILTCLLVTTGGVVSLQVNGWIAPVEAPGTPRFTEVRPAVPARPHPVLQVCAWIRWRSGDQGLGAAYHAYLLELSQAAMAADSRGLHALGRELLDALHRGDPDDMALGEKAIRWICDARLTHTRSTM
ncbi:M48 family metalloprotease [Nonomuraea soli]|uniref:Zn-dependent protease with chaperone function n=1 Tax=Nonomuraea soli TaxID=1032476 RepID=A0A7W0CFT2_9ACTN|nr:M48 family metalloprotease [Nonomuraea soli]MBA2890204.1 Zn-dependent protease with chaperone function [Nonomuraea soli]